MLRSLFAGVTGLASNIVELDVVGNNISNVNTVGFKSARVTFQEILTQNLRTATRPSATGGLGGTNPQQIGLGTIVGSIDSEFSQGNIRVTGNKTDLAIQGDGFFVVSDGISQQFTRAGNFTFDANNSLVSAGTGMKVQGQIAGPDGTFGAGSIGDIQIDPSVVVPAEATSEVQVWGNLSSASDASGTSLIQTGALLADAIGADDLTTLRSGSDGTALGLSNGNVIALLGSVGGSSISSVQFTVGEVVDGGDGTSIEQLRSWFETELNNAGAAGASVTLNGDGSMTVNNASGQLMEDIQLQVGGRPAFNQAMLFGQQIPAGETASSTSLLSPAEEGDVLDTLYNGSADRLDFSFVGGSTEIDISGTRGGEAITPGGLTVIQGTTTLGDMLSVMESSFQISNQDGIAIDSSGRITVQGDEGLPSGIGNISITEAGNINSNITSSIDFSVLSPARDADEFSVTSVIYDSLGAPHNLTMSFEKRTGENTWDWFASLDGDETITSGAAGTVNFDDSGSLQSFLYTDGGGQIVIQPQAAGESGAAPMSITINPGDIGGSTGLTQFEPEGQIQSVANGFTVGSLIDFDIDRSGVISGRFSNDTVRDLARIGMARFSNANALTRIGGNTYAVSGNSGTPIVGFATEGGIGELNNGALEASNVDLSDQFTRLVVAQRAFQSNARVISTSDEVLQELVNIV